MSQAWVLDRLVRLGGLEALWPDAAPAFLEMGFKLADLRRSTQQLPGLTALGQRWAQLGDEHAARARAAEEADHKITAVEAYHRASICYGFAQWTIRDDLNANKRNYHTESVRCYEKVISHGPARIERVLIPFGDFSISGVLHLPEVLPAPVVLILPGLDMVKEYFPVPHNNMFTRRGLAALVLDGPGQGETNLRGLKLTPHNFEQATSAAIDYVQERPDTRGTLVGAFAIGTGAYYALSAATQETRLHCVVGFEGGVFYDKVAFSKRAQPNFRANMMYMLGNADPEAFDLALSSMTLQGREDQIRVPTLLIQGEFDELMELEDAHRFYDACPAAVELVIYRGEGHVLGGVFPEALAFSIDWLSDRLRDPENRSAVRRIVHVPSVL